MTQLPSSQQAATGSGAPAIASASLNEPIEYSASAARPFVPFLNSRAAALLASMIPARASINDDHIAKSCDVGRDLC